VISLDVLLEDYPGDASWTSYVSAICPQRDVGVLAPAFIAVDADVASVVTVLLGDRASD
jgi:hypothetical protein